MKQTTNQETNGNIAFHVPAYPCHMVTTSPNDTEWLELPQVQLVDVVSGEIPRLQTHVSMCATKNALHLRFWCLDDIVYSPYTTHDDPLYEADVVECFIDPVGRHESHFEFNVSPNNVVFDARIINEQGAPVAYHPEWDAAGLVTQVVTYDAKTFNGRFDQQVIKEGDKVLVYDVAIPFAALEVAASPAPGDEWRINLFRIDQDAQHERTYTAWSPTSEVKFHVPTRFGRLQFV